MASTKRLEGADFVQDTVRRSMPDLKRPRLRTESEKKFAEIEQKSAEAYAGMEALTRSFTDLATELEDDEAETAEAVPTRVTEDWEDTSMVHVVEEVRVKVAKKDTP